MTITREPASRVKPSPTAQEVMATLDKQHMMILVRDLITYMPQCYKDELKRRRILDIDLKGYKLQIFKTG